MELVFFLEERSAKEFLDQFLVRVLPTDVTFRTIPHNGKSDLQKSLPIKLRAWRNPESRFVVLHDKDSNDCIELKAQLREICLRARPDLNPLIRIACHELESWYLGNFDALGVCFDGFDPDSFRNRAKYRDVDALPNAAEELTSLVPSYQKVGGSRMLGKLLDPHSNTSRSFQTFVSGLMRIIS